MRFLSTCSVSGSRYFFGLSGTHEVSSSWMRSRMSPESRWRLPWKRTSRTQSRPLAASPAQPTNARHASPAVSRTICLAMPIPTVHGAHRVPRSSGDQREGVGTVVAVMSLRCTEGEELLGDLHQLVGALAALGPARRDA